MRPRRTPHLLGAGLLAGLLTACYSYAPVAIMPDPETRVAVLLSDQGRVGASSQIGSQAARVEGSVVSSSDTGYLLAVSSVKPIRGAWVKWTGETVSLRRDYVTTLYERRLSKGRTAAFVGGVAGVLAVAVFGFDILGIGNDRLDTIGTGDPPVDQ
jgi:hypothetical protein